MNFLEAPRRNGGSADVLFSARPVRSGYWAGRQTGRSAGGFFVGARHTVPAPWSLWRPLDFQASALACHSEPGPAIYAGTEVRNLLFAVQASMPFGTACRTRRILIRCFASSPSRGACLSPACRRQGRQAAIVFSPATKRACRRHAQRSAGKAWRKHLSPGGTIDRL